MICRNQPDGYSRMGHGRPIEEQLMIGRYSGYSFPVVCKGNKQAAKQRLKINVLDWPHVGSTYW